MPVWFQALVRREDNPLRLLDALAVIVIKGTQALRKALGFHSLVPRHFGRHPNGRSQFSDQPDLPDQMDEAASHTRPAERRQVAALPWRRGPDGLEIMLVTSRETRRWVTPKGGRMSGRTDAEAAAIEALEEAGIEGNVAVHPVGTFRYLKALKRRAPRWCVVAVYPLEVLTEHAHWQEKAERERVWVSRDEAVRRVDEPDLKALIATFEG